MSFKIFLLACTLQDLQQAMKDLGLNPTESEIQDLINEVERNGHIYYPAFCKVIMRKFREEPEEAFRQELFRTLVGSKDYPEGTVAPLYNINKEDSSGYSTNLFVLDGN